VRQHNITVALTSNAAVAHDTFAVKYAYQFNSSQVLSFDPLYILKEIKILQELEKSALNQIEYQIRFTSESV